MILRIYSLRVIRSTWVSVMHFTCLIFPFRGLNHDTISNWTERGFLCRIQYSTILDLRSIFFTPTLSNFYGRSPSRREGNVGANSLGPPCKPAGGSYLLSPRLGSGDGLVWWTIKAQDSVGRRISLSRKLIWKSNYLIVPPCWVCLTLTECGPIRSICTVFHNVVSFSAMFLGGSWL